MGRIERDDSSLSRFGAPCGMITRPDWDALEFYAFALNEGGYGYLCREVGKTEYDEADPPLEMLRDWEWSGEAPKPDWL